MPRLHTYSRFVPRPIREAVREQVLLPLAVRGLRRPSPPSRRLLQQARLGWGNLGWAPTLPFLEEVAHYAGRTPGPILECGSGLTTLLLRLRGVAADSLVSLEHEASCYEKVAGSLSRWRLGTAGLRLVPLREYDGEFTWYDVAAVGIPDAIRLVICDGPPRTTPGGRYGLLALLASKLAPGCVILLDDADTESVRDTLQRWVDEFHGEVQPPGHDARVAVYVHRERAGEEAGGAG